MWSVSLFVLFALAAVKAQVRYKLCATEDMLFKCKPLEKDNNAVACLSVADSAECAIRLSRGEADFGMFTAEELLLTSQFYPSEIVPIFQLKHSDRLKEEFDFQAVAVVSQPIENSRGEFKALKNGGICHPGFSESERWNDYILKYFERNVAKSVCDADITAAENEVQHIKSFFGKACRPGEWVPDTDFDQTLKETYPELCELCDNPASCNYRNRDGHGHIGALDCLKSGRGKVAYVALSHVRKYFQENETYYFLCPDGTTLPSTVETPCAWIKQPWGVIAARKSIATELTASLKEWILPMRSDSWQDALRKIVNDQGEAMPLQEGTSMVSYLSKGREVDLPSAQSCESRPTIKWCTIGDLETNKCNWMAKEAKALGIEPKIECLKSKSIFQCFRDINGNESDLITIDSNYGFLARKVYDLRTVLYSSTANDRNSVVVAVVRNSEDNKVTDFNSLRGRTACFPEYGGIAWLSFVYVMRSSNVITSKSCDYPKLVADFLSGACTPGIMDTDHSNRTSDHARSTPILCSACSSDSTENLCSASKDNPYFGDSGALKCLNESGDIAFIEMRNLKEMDLDPNMYRVLCRNGSLASYPGFDVDDFCALSVTVDSEIVGRKNSTDVEYLDTTTALLKIEDWLGYSVHKRAPISIYEKFNATSNLLFKDSTTGLVNTSSTLPAVQAYKQLFDHVETCSDGALSIIANFSSTLLITLSSILIGRFL